MLACRDLLDEPVDTAGYLYVGPNGPDLKMRTFSEAELDSTRAAVVEQLGAIMTVATTDIFDADSDVEIATAVGEDLCPLEDAFAAKH